MKSDIFYKTCCSRLSHTAHSREYARTDGPVAAILFRVSGELHLAICIKSLEGISNCFHLVGQFMLSFRLYHSQDCRKPVDLTGIHRSKRALVEHLSSRDIDFPHGNHRPGSLSHILEIHHCVCLKRCNFQGIHLHLTEEG